MPELKIAVQLNSLRMPLRRGLQAAAKLGVAAVELEARGEIRPQELTDTGLRQIRKMLEDANLRVAAVGYHTRRGYNVEDELDRRVAGTKAAMKFAYDVGAAVVVNQIGRVPAESSGREWQLLVEVLHDLANWGQRSGALLAAETGSESGADMARLWAALPDGGIGVTLDPGNLIANGFLPLEAVTHLGPSIMHVHARDGVRDLAKGRGIETPLGRGSVDFAALLGALEEHEYRGYFSVEHSGSENPVEEISQAVQYLRNL